jgi:hypothetical protein
MRKTCAQHVQRLCTVFVAARARAVACGKAHKLYAPKPLVVRSTVHSKTTSFLSVGLGVIPTFHSAYIKTGKIYKQLITN